MIYQRLTKDLPSLPNTYQQLTKIFFQFTKDLPMIYKVETKKELVSTVERLKKSPLAVERVDWSRLDSRDLIQ